MIRPHWHETDARVPHGTRFSPDDRDGDWEELAPGMS